MSAKAALTASEAAVNEMKVRQSRMTLRAALLSYGGVTFVNGVAAMVVVYVLWAAGWI
mgnify:CR=1 FL=1